jgi:hypothetical protein
VGWRIAADRQLVNSRSKPGTLSPAEPAPEVDDLRTLVTISRTHPTDCGQRQVVARLDRGAKVTLLFGESFTMELSPGAHRLLVHNTLMWKHVKFAVESGEHLEFVVINRARWWTYGMVGVLGAAPLFLTVQRRSLA